MAYIDPALIIGNYFSDSISRQRIIVECGAATGDLNPSLGLEKDYGWKYFGIEPDPRTYDSLMVNRPNATTINAALSDMIGKTKFTISAWFGNSSLNHCEEHRQELQEYIDKRPNLAFSDGAAFKDITVSTMTWDYFINQHQLSNIDFLMLDVEGSELTVLKGFTKKSVLPSVIQIEYGYSDPENRYLNESTKENFSGFLAIYRSLYDLGYDFDYAHHNDAFFSLRTFWKNKARPSSWLGETYTFSWSGYCRYHKDRCSEAIERLHAQRR